MVGRSVQLRGLWKNDLTYLHTYLPTYLPTYTSESSDSSDISDSSDSSDNRDSSDTSDSSDSGDSSDSYDSTDTTVLWRRTFLNEFFVTTNILFYKKICVRNKFCDKKME